MAGASEDGSCADRPARVLADRVRDLYGYDPTSWSVGRPTTPQAGVSSPASSPAGQHREQGTNDDDEAKFYRRRLVSSPIYERALMRDSDNLRRYEKPTSSQRKEITEQTDKALERKQERERKEALGWYRWSR